MSAPFVNRHIGPDNDQVATMLDRLGYPSIDALMDAAVPKSIRSADALELPAAADEETAAAELRALAAANVPGEPMIGQGYYDTVTPAGHPPQHPRSTRPGTPPTRRTSRKSRRAASRRC